MTAIRRIRLDVFQVSQAELAQIAGVRQATVSRWERGELEPSLSALERIREAAIARGLDWHDRWLFEAPEDTTQ